ncbi:MAG: PD-(D/E)XK nuclease family protein, partial [Lentisphaeria bacterium]|nr:PD-(D/E)XK nuclease family protein [Lentisphaeria bacterium]
MRKIETLLDLWEYKCEMCSAEKSENSDDETNSIKLMDLIRTRADATNFNFVEHIRSAEEFSTQILCKLLNDIEAFQLEFLQQIGLFAECNKENFNKLVVEAEHSVGKSEKYDLSFWKEKKEPEEKELVCIVEVKIDADFQPNQLGRYYDNLPKCEFGAKESGLATLTKYCVQLHQQVKKA